jgi:4-amino-4-deoxy-L-arabinose transferase-like glycosyltransferase
LTKTSRRAFVATLLIVVVWLALRWPHGSLWYDEALSTWVASGPWQRLIHWCTQVDIQVPLHYVVLRGWMALLGNSEFALHLLSALCGLLAVAGLFALVHRLTRITSAAVIAALLLGLSPGFAWIAFEVRAYALALALYAWASVFLYECLKPGPPRWALAACCGLALATLYTHYTGIGALAAHGLIATWVFVSRRSGPLLRRMAGMGSVIVAGFAPWLPVLLSRSAADRSYYAGAILPDQTLGVLLSFKWLARDDFKWLTPDHRLSPLVPLVAGGLLVLVAGLVVWLLRQHRTMQPLIYGLCMLLVPAAMVAVVVLFKPKLAGRYAWPAWIGLDLLLAMGVVALTTPPNPLSASSHRGKNRSGARPTDSALSRWRGAGGKFKLLILAVILLAVPWLSGQTGHPPESDFRGAFAYIREHWQTGDLVLLRDGTLFPVADYYRSPEPYIGLPASDLTDATHILHAAEAVPVLAAQGSAIRGVWIVSWQGNVMDPENVSAGLLETIGKRQAVQPVFGDVGLEYFALARPLSALSVPPFSQKPLLSLPGGPTLDSARLLTGDTIKAGEALIAHTWWWRGDPVQIDTRVSIRLYGADGRALGQIDQPPAGWFYFPDHWPERTLILGRYEMQLPPDTAGPVTMKLVVYSADNSLAPSEVTIGTVRVQ